MAGWAAVKLRLAQWDREREEQRNWSLARRTNSSLLNGEYVVDDPRARRAKFMADRKMRGSIVKPVQPGREAEPDRCLLERAACRRVPC